MTAAIELTMAELAHDVANDDAAADVIDEDDDNEDDDDDNDVAGIDGGR